MSPDTLDHRFDRLGRRSLLVLSLLLLLAVGGCGGTSDATGSASGGAGSTAADTPQPIEGKVAATATGSAPETTRNAVAPLSRAVISTGEIALHSSHVSDARDEVRQKVALWGGTVADEQTQSDPKGGITDSTMTLRVPTARFDVAMNGLARIGKVQHQSRTSEDVTTQVIDNQVRVRAAQRSISAIENLLGRATRISDIITIESDLASRQADLDSLERQQAWLSDQTSLSTIDVHLTRTVAPPPKKKTDAHGFVGGLEQGWSAMRSASVAALTVAGALLPFALLALLVGVPLWVVVRRRRPGAAIQQSAAARTP